MSWTDDVANDAIGLIEFPTRGSCEGNEAVDLETRPLARKIWPERTKGGLRIWKGHSESSQDISGAWKREK